MHSCIYNIYASPELNKFILYKKKQFSQFCEIKVRDVVT